MNEIINIIMPIVGVIVGGLIHISFKKGYLTINENSNLKKWKKQRS